MNSDRAKVDGTLSIWQRVLLAVLVAYPSVLIVLAMVNGPGISIDSVSYAAASQSWANSSQLLSFDGTALTIFPPGLPVISGSLMMVGVPFQWAVVVLNVAATVVAVLGAFWLGRVVLTSTAWGLGAAAVVSLAAATVRVNSYFWTEPVFSAVVVGVLVLIVRGARARHYTWLSVIAIGLLISLAIGFRYVGVILVPLAVVVVLWRTARQRWLKALAVGAVSLLGFIAVTGRNVLLGAPMLGDRYPGSIGPEGALLGLVRNWGEYVAPSRTTSLTVLAGALVAVLLLVGAWLVLVRRNVAGFVLAVLVLGYWTSIVVGQVGTRLDVATERFGAPVLVPSVILVLVAIRALMTSMSDQLAESGLMTPSQSLVLVRAASGALAVVVLGLSMLHTVRFVADANRNGLGLDSGAALDRDISQVAAELPGEVVAASNDPWQVWWARQGGVALDFPPSRDEWPAERVDSDLRALASAVEANGVVLLLLDSGSRASVDVVELESSGMNVELVDTQGAVSVYELTPQA